ncbi:hypothetical protein FHU41_002444 [Psychromicrobium silvestre]|uniref:Uncharacterized protein n=1 Tax=Psychromicrobium silvestre TaxID=1645614 RepID=A0A7Y9LV79_9MICC|nr:hypothetical protein [Psychromicrobium silvestre]NYE96194.1 hypothetical protein [Psychromicrobium silvestre]
MGVLRDFFRLADAGMRQRERTDWRENLRQSADLAEQFSNTPEAYGVSEANPFKNLTLYASMIQGNGTVISLNQTSQAPDGTPIYTVELELRFPNQAPYRSNYRTMIALSALPGWQPGAMFPFRVSPDDPNALMLG